MAIGACWLLAGWICATSSQASPAAAPVPNAPVPTAPATACNLVANDNTIDYGRFSPYDVPPAAPSSPALPLGKRIIVLHATCDMPQHMAIFFQGEADGAGQFRFGPEGHLTIRLLKAQLDGKPAPMGQVRSIAQPPASHTPDIAITPEFGAMAAGAGRHLSLQVEFEAAVPRSAMRPSMDQIWRSNGRFVLETRPSG